jgi:hypothetical protein
MFAVISLRQHNLELVNRNGNSNLEELEDIVTGMIQILPLNYRGGNMDDQEETNEGIWDVTPCGSCKNRRFGGT